MVAIGYIRVSTEGQAEEGVSLTAQRVKIEAWAKLHDEDEVLIFEDAGISGSSMAARHGLQKALGEVCRRRGAFVVYSLSRLARSTKDTLAISEQLARSGAELVSLSERIDTTTASGKMVFRMLAVLAEFERDQVSERTRAAMAHLRSSRRRFSRYPPYGWDLDRKGETLVANRAEQAVIRKQAQRIYDLFARRVTEGRGEKIKDIDAVAHGRVFTARQAVRNGLVDKVGGFREAISTALTEAKLDKCDFLVLPRPKTLMDLIQGSSDSATPVGSQIAGALGATGALQRIVRHRGLAYLLTVAEMLGRDRVLTTMPHYLSVQP